VTGRARRSDGFVLPELIIVMAIGLVLLMATLVTFDTFVSNSNENAKRTDSADQARTALEIEARQLRNLAKRVNNAAVINTVKSYDIVFQTSDPQKTWIRYCLDTSLGSDKGRLWQQTQSADTPGTTAACGPTASGWAKNYAVASNVVNQIDGRDDPIFNYRCISGGTACTASSATWDQIIGVDAQLDIDTTPRKAPPEQEVQSGVYLRNQNQAPIAAMAPITVASQPHTLQLNASGSSDFEGRTLEYYWFLGTMPTNIQCGAPKETVSGTAITMWGGTYLGRGVILQYQWPAAGTAQVGLVACDPGDRFDFITRTVNIP
jgi:prepilin-type N-terminal cleavage/methylation domain-containing protein